MIGISFSYDQNQLKSQQDPGEITLR